MENKKAIETFKTMYPKKCKMIDGRYTGGYDDYESEKGQAVTLAIEALEKQIAKKPLIRYENMGFGSPNETFKIYGCPCCKEELDEATSFCQNCGQAIDWSEG